MSLYSIVCLKLPVLDEESLRLSVSPTGGVSRLVSEAGVDEVVEDSDDDDIARGLCGRGGPGGRCRC